MSRTLRLTAAAEADIVAVLEHSDSEFGREARQRYETLLTTALRDVAMESDRPGSVARPELGENILSWHLRNSRERARLAGGAVGRPRHLIVYTAIDEETVVILRILHDAMELQRHLERD